ncbi:uncharacterized protein EV154DRAFT_428376 [Mucor mucedo]|uniref:uncharacterized protein n=1 Tax=Mucor mucedo TaxID=29922 RepID=UPI00221EACD7|nr:uncharacterized protein EV154DRAFT_428376 [Mucor mucedo]KAI7882289.1 hypothetical protein EV154DRAFT_428376 [Mucor mucedo]
MDVFEVTEKSKSTMVAAFNETFGVGSTFDTMSQLRPEANEYGRKHNMVFVTVRSDFKNNSIVLACKHYGEYRSAHKLAKDPTVDLAETGTSVTQRYVKDSQRCECSRFIKIKKSVSGSVVVYESYGLHNHPIPGDKTTYAANRLQPAEVMKLIMQTLNLCGPNSVETTMQVYLKNYCHLNLK